MSFVWYCRDIEDKEFVPSNLTSEPLVSDEDNIVLPINAVGTTRILSSSHCLSKALLN